MTSTDQNMDQQRPGFEYPETYYNSRSASVVLPILFATHRPRSVLDLGCGNGSWLRVALELGIEDVLGIEYPVPEEQALKIPKRCTREIDLGKAFNLDRKYDLALCLEVAEHLPEASASVLVDGLVAHADVIVFSAAIPGQGGDGHLNEQPPAYWQRLFNERGFETFDDLRPLIWENDQVFWWYRQNMFTACRQGRKMDRPAGNIPFLVHPALFRETEGFMAGYERKFHEYRDAYQKLEREWNKLDRSTAYHLRRLKEIFRDRISPKKPHSGS